MKPSTGSTEDTTSMESNIKVPPTPPSTPLPTPSNFFRSGIDNAIEAVLKGTSGGVGSSQPQQPEQGKESEDSVVVDGVMDSNNGVEPVHGPEVKIQVWFLFLLFVTARVRNSRRIRESIFAKIHSKPSTRIKRDSCKTLKNPYSMSVCKNPQILTKTSLDFGESK